MSRIRDQMRFISTGRCYIYDLLQIFRATRCRHIFRGKVFVLIRYHAALLTLLRTAILIVMASSMSEG